MQPAVTQNPRPEQTAVVTGATGPLGAALSELLIAAGFDVVGVARGQAGLATLAGRLGGRFHSVVADPADPVTPGAIVDRYRPAVVVLNASAWALPRTLARHTWETFTATWNVDVRQMFNWTSEALSAPLPPGSTVIGVSSSVALTGAPLSVGFASAKAAIPMIARFAAAEAQRSDLGIQFLAALPGLMQETPRGTAVAGAYAALRRRTSGDAMGPPPPSTGLLSVGDVASQLLELALGQDSLSDGGSYLLTADGLQEIGRPADAPVPAR